MKTKKLLLTLISGTLLLSIFISSCQKDEEAEPTPTVTDARDNYAGNWTCDETSKQNGRSTYAVNITKSSTNSAQVFLNNFYNLGSTNYVYADVSGSTITIPSQTFSGNTAWGSGTLIGPSAINFTYYVFDGAVTDTVTASYSR